MLIRPVLGEILSEASETGRVNSRVTAGLKRGPIARASCEGTAGRGRLPSPASLARGRRARSEATPSLAPPRLPPPPLANNHFYQIPKEGMMLGIFTSQSVPKVRIIFVGRQIRQILPPLPRHNFFSLGGRRQRENRAGAKAAIHLLHVVETFRLSSRSCWGNGAGDAFLNAGSGLFFLLLFSNNFRDSPSRPPARPVLESPPPAGSSRGPARHPRRRSRSNADETRQKKKKGRRHSSNHPAVSTTCLSHRQLGPSVAQPPPDVCHTANSFGLSLTPSLSVYRPLSFILRDPIPGRAAPGGSARPHHPEYTSLNLRQESGGGNQTAERRQTLCAAHPLPTHPHPPLASSPASRDRPLPNPPPTPPPTPASLPPPAETRPRTPTPSTPPHPCKPSSSSRDPTENPPPHPPPAHPCKPSSSERDPSRDPPENPPHPPPPPPPTPARRDPGPEPHSRARQHPDTLHARRGSLADPPVSLRHHSSTFQPVTLTSLRNFF
ncbi:hypothetical protein C7M84_014396 [Penaeus vannamei]|uniref:Uncharacterized protein n=1 Tax=Penaeus vannamei TaxID=6689 RepID=A0A3R7QHD0_PENVA|nr:hypothetical protein C7M84_014396 [Penaeus vannamei]